MRGQAEAVRLAAGSVDAAATERYEIPLYILAVLHSFVLYRSYCVSMLVTFQLDAASLVWPFVAWPTLAVLKCRPLSPIRLH